LGRFKFEKFSLKSLIENLYDHYVLVYTFIQICFLLLQLCLANSGVARVPCALGQKIFLRPHQQNCRVWKWKIRAKARKKQWQNICCWDFCSFPIGIIQYRLRC